MGQDGAVRVQLGGPGQAIGGPGQAMQRAVLHIAPAGRPVQQQQQFSATLSSANGQPISIQLDAQQAQMLAAGQLLKLRPGGLAIKPQAAAAQTMRPVQAYYNQPQVQQPQMQQIVQVQELSNGSRLVGAGLESAVGGGGGRGGVSPVPRWGLGCAKRLFARPP
jgi:hypothetical protein